MHRSHEGTMPDLEVSSSSFRIAGHTHQQGYQRKCKRLGVEIDAERTCSLISDLRRADHAPSCQTMEKWCLETILSSGLGVTQVKAVGIKLC